MIFLTYRIQLTQAQQRHYFHHQTQIITNNNYDNF